MIKSRFARLPAGASLLLLVLTPLQAADEQPGVLWESTSKMVMEGLPMSMPAQTTKICTARQWTQPPPGGDKSCTSSNFRLVDSKATWTVKCSAPSAMTGVGEIIFKGADSYSGELKFTSSEMNMTVKLTGRKLGGCDKPQ